MPNNTHNIILKSLGYVLHNLKGKMKDISKTDETIALQTSTD